MGLESIAEVKRTPDVQIFRRMFSNSKMAIKRAFDRPPGNLVVMIRMESRFLHYRDGYIVGNIRLNRSVFAPGWVLTGQAPVSAPAPAPQDSG